ncbi:MAG: 4-hydroxybutyrate CoA-transferase [Bacteroidia bacterium]|nr:MAG: 4-hydroxybutyrate CoA-transferase [Bacteroidia bacterium]
MYSGQDYKSKLRTASEAVTHIKSGNRVVLGHAAGVPIDTLEALVAAKENYQDVEIVSMFTLNDGPYMAPGMEKHFRHNALFVAPNARKCIEEKRGDFTTCFFHEVPRLFSEGPMPVDVALVSVTRPNAEGYCSFGVSCDYSNPACKAAKVVIAEANDQMPFIAGGDNLIHVSEIDHIVETSHPLFELPAPKIGELETKIGQYCAELVKDGDTLQLGIGSIPDAVLQQLTDKKHLGIHTEMFADGVVDLVNAGVIDGSQKTLHKGKMVATFLMGGKKLYDFVDNNPDVLLFPCSYVNDPRIIMQNNNMVSINSCLQIDLMGQVCSESMGLRQFSGVGGQVDYVRGARMGGGLSVMAMPSTAAKGKVSRITPFLDEGAAVTTSRNDVDYVVTEYGIAHLWGKTLKQRAQELISIAHPDFRPALQEEFKKRF